MDFEFRDAVVTQGHARVGLIGPTGSGKTLTALLLAKAWGGKIAVLDTEHGSASKYADVAPFKVVELASFSPQTYIDAIAAAAKCGFDTLIIDSLSHAWTGTEGALEQADKGAIKYGGNKWAAWRDVTPLQNKLIEAMLAYPGHLIATMRSKMDYIQTQDSNGRTIIKKVGMAPVQREGMEYEFDIVGDMDLAHNLVITKTRCRALDGQVIALPGEALAETIKAWVSHGAVPAPKPEPIQTAPPAPAKTPRPIDWTTFWQVTERLGLTPEEVCVIGEVGAIEDFMALDPDKVRALTPALKARAKANKEAAA